MIEFKDLKEVSDGIWEIPRSYWEPMRCAARVYISRTGLTALLGEKSLEQLINVATLPGVEYASAMPDIHQGYGFPIGGVAAIRAQDGVISPGGVGYDINCGVRVLGTPFSVEDVRSRLEELATQMQRDVPSGVGRGGEFMLGEGEMKHVLGQGVRWAIKRGYGTDDDAEYTEEYGSYQHADSGCVSEAAKKRGSDQLGTIGSGNHFIEVQEVVHLYDSEIAETFGLSLGQVVVMIHTGSRGLGHQVCTDYVRLMNSVRTKYDIFLPDRELACAPFKSPEGQSYFKAMAAAANFAWANRQIITYQIRNAWKRVLKTREADNLRVVYDVAHNIAKLETYAGKEYIVHRKGATRAFGPHSPEIPERYQGVGQPVLVPGSMGTFSYILVGTETAMTETFGSSCHGAGRQLSRTKAKKSIDYTTLKQQLDEYGVVVRAGSAQGLLEEAPQAYKDVNGVVDSVERAAIAKPVVKLKPLAVIKG